jgi:hypothetical protein
MRTLCSALAAVAAIAGLAAARGEQSEPEWYKRIPVIDRNILQDVAQEYGLFPEPTRLLHAIYLAEGGPPGRELGVLVEEARRFKGNHEKSLRLQAQWCAGTIRNRYTGDLASFARRYCPPAAHAKNRNWLPNVSKLMNN